jgi:hypothetical protein
MMPFLGMCAARYVRASLAIVTKRMQYCESKMHILQYLAAVAALCETIWPVMAANAGEIEKIVAKARGNGAQFDEVERKCRAVEETIARSPPLLVFPE